LEHHNIKPYRKHIGKVPCILSLGTRGKCMVSFMLQLPIVEMAIKPKRKIPSTGINSVAKCIIVLFIYCKNKNNTQTHTTKVQQELKIIFLKELQSTW
jgi:hypothetical protein